MQGIISGVRLGSIAEAAGIIAGEALVAVNGIAVRDIIELSFLLADEQAELLIRNTNGVERTVQIEKRTDEDLGLEFESAAFDGVRTCHNKCVFCFVDQMIPGMRPGLYVRDDDYRLSFLYGNFITLTNMKDADFNDIITKHLSPLYVSIHATDAQVRCRMMNNCFAGELLPRLKTLLAAGIEVHTQIVCCPGYNDGEVLAKTYKDLRALAPGIQSMAVVPVGLTKNRAGLTPMRLFTQSEAVALVDMVSAWQRECRKTMGKSFIYLGDEFYLLAEKPLPTAKYYDGFPQIENGIGLSRSFIDEWQTAADVVQTSASTQNAVIPVGTAAFKVLQPLIDRFNRVHHTQHKLLSVVNSFFGATVNVTGLLCGQDILAAVDGVQRVVLPAVVLNSDDLFLDDMKYADFRREFEGVVQRAASAKELHRLLLE